MLIACPRQTAVLLFLRPISQQFPPQMLDLFDGSHFRFIRRAARRHCLIHHVRDGMKSGQYVRASSHSLFQRRRLCCCLFVFIVHEPLQLYKTPPRIQAYFIENPKNLKHHSLERHFQSHPERPNNANT